MILNEESVFSGRLHDGDGLMGRRYITHSPVSGAKGETTIRLLMFTIGKSSHSRPVSDRMLANRYAKQTKV